LAIPAKISAALGIDHKMSEFRIPSFSAGWLRLKMVVRPAPQETLDLSGFPSQNVKNPVRVCLELTSHPFIR
jgi:hypothetical protein